MSERDKEVKTAQRLWEVLEELSNLLWTRYEREFIEMHLADEDRRQAMLNDSLESDAIPF